MPCSPPYMRQLWWRLPFFHHAYIQLPPTDHPLPIWNSTPMFGTRTASYSMLFFKDMLKARCDGRVVFAAAALFWLKEMPKVSDIHSIFSLQGDAGLCNRLIFTTICVSATRSSGNRYSYIYRYGSPSRSVSSLCLYIAVSSQWVCSGI